MSMNDVWEINQEYRFDEESGLYRGHYKEVVGGETNLEQAGLKIVLALHTLLSNIIAPNLASETDLVCTTARKVSGEGSRVFTQYGTEDIGSMAGPPIEAGTAVLVSKYTATNNAHARGRAFMPFLSKDFSFNGLVTVEHAITLEAMAEDYLNPQQLDVDDVGEMVGVVWSGTTSASFDIVNVVLRPRLASQRRRKVHHQPFGPIQSGP